MLCGACTDLSVAYQSPWMPGSRQCRQALKSQGMWSAALGRSDRRVIPAFRSGAGSGHLVPDGAWIFSDHPEHADDSSGGGDGGAGLAGPTRTALRPGALAGAAPGRRRGLFFGLAVRGWAWLPVLVLVVLATAWASRYASLQVPGRLALGIAAFCAVPVHQGPGAAAAARRSLAEQPATGRRRQCRRQRPLRHHLLAQ